MLISLGTLINLFLIILIFLRIPPKDVGLTSFATQSNLLGSPNSAQRFLNGITGIGIIIYFLIAIKLNLLSN